MAKRKYQKYTYNHTESDWMSGLKLINNSPLKYFYTHTDISVSGYDKGYSSIDKGEWGCVYINGRILLNSCRDATPREWEYIIAHCMLHLGFGHFKEGKDTDPYWNAACDWVIAKFLKDTHLGVPPKDFDHQFPISIRNEDQVYEYIKNHPEILSTVNFSTMGDSEDMIYNIIGKEDSSKLNKYFYNPPTDYVKELAISLEESIKESIKEAKNGKITEVNKEKDLEEYKWNRPREWFISNYPLLGAIAASFKVIYDNSTVYRLGIPIAAVNAKMKEIYINTKAMLHGDEWRFVFAHEFLHAALRHDERCEDRNPLLWNVACDYVINGWLVDMKIGTIPEGLLYDENFKNMSAESLYDLLYNDIRHHLNATDGKSGDIIYGNPNNTSGNWSKEELDEFYRRAMQQGLEYHERAHRGYLPAELIEEINAMSMPPIKWDVELAKWFDENFEPIEKHRTYSRMSRRQSSTLDIPRPAWRMEEELVDHRIFAVVLDTSGSMDRHLLAEALGTIASYSESRDVHHIRLVFCDARAYDQGVISPDDLAKTVEVKGRGGTILQPGIDCLDNDEDFPKEAPLLIITDGYCENHLNLRGRNHAYLIPYGNRLPFNPKGPVFKLK